MKAEASLYSFRFVLFEKRIRKQMQGREVLLKKFLWISDPVDFVILRLPRPLRGLAMTRKKRPVRSPPCERARLERATN